MNATRARARAEIRSPVTKPRTRSGLLLRRVSAASARGLSEICLRATDLVVSAVAIIALSPALVLRGGLGYRRTGKVFERAPKVGRFRRPFERLSFAGSARGRRLAVLVNVLRGDLSFVGPRALDPDEAALVAPRFGARFEVRPGLVSAHVVKSRSKIAYETESASDTDYAYSKNLRGDTGLLARSVVTGLLAGRADRPCPPILDFFGIPVTNTTMDEAVDWILERARKPEPCELAFVNPHCLNLAWSGAEYKKVLLAQDRVLPDGIGIHLGCRILGTALAANVNGTDMFPLLSERLSKTDTSIFLLGAKPEVAAEAGRRMAGRFPGLRIAGTHHGFFDAQGEGRVIDEINASGAGILLAAFGVPRQELWLHAHRDDLRPSVRMGVGGLFDFYSGRIPRAPSWLREIGLEWAWRFLQEPGRMWKRYFLGNPLFLYRVWKQARATQHHEH